MKILPASEKAAEYCWFARRCMQQARNTGLPGQAAHVDGLTTVLCKYTAEQATLIALTSSGVILHPRSGPVQGMPYLEYQTDNLISFTVPKSAVGVRGGWRNGATPLDTPYPFPLLDEDNASFVVTSADSGLAGEFAADTGNYGNLYWTNGNVTDPVVLSWKGTPTRHFRLPSSIDLPGLSLLETTRPYGGEDVPEFTAFGPNLYQSGEVYREAPRYSWPRNGGGTVSRCLILGGMEDANGTVYIVAQSDRNRSPVGGAGFWLMLWKDGAEIDGWQKVFEQPYTRNGLPWFGNASGTEFVCSNGDRLTAGGVFTAHAAGDGIYAEIGNTVPNFEASYSGDVYHEFRGDLRYASKVSAGFTAKTAGSSTAPVVVSRTETVVVVVEEIVPISISGPDSYVENAYSASGGNGDYTWTFPSNSCGMGVVTVTDSCGNSVSKDVRLPLGHWGNRVYEEQFDYGQYVYNINGSTKKTYTVGSVPAGAVCRDSNIFKTCGNQSFSFNSGALLLQACGGVSAYITSAPSMVCGACSECGGLWDGFYYRDCMCFAGALLYTETWVCA